MKDLTELSNIFMNLTMPKNGRDKNLPPQQNRTNDPSHHVMKNDPVQEPRVNGKSQILDNPMQNVKVTQTRVCADHNRKFLSKIRVVQIFLIIIIFLILIWSV